jgi:hypothetical protein
MSNIIDDSRKGLTDQKLNSIKNASESTRNAQSGIGRTVKQEVIPLRNDTPAEKTIKGLNNSHIVLGKDRDDEPNTGYGGRGYGRSGMIHLVAGHYGAGLDDVSEDPTNPSIANPNFNYYFISSIVISFKIFYIPLYQSQTNKKFL